MYKLELQNVSYVYSPKTAYEKVALDNVNVGFEEGKTTGIIGHTGSGKSTLVQLLNGLEKPSSGKVLLDGKDIWEHPKKIRDVRFKVGLTMQYPEYQLFEETVRKDIAFGPKNMGLEADEIERRVLDAVDTVGLDRDVLEKSPFDLSGGQKRRVAIAGVMATEPEVLVLDEPASGLDPEGRELIFSSIAEYKKRKNATIIIVSHSMEDMARWCDNLIVMSDAKVAMSGKRDAIFERSSELSFFGLDVPQITHLMLALRSRGVNISENIYTVDAAVAALTDIFGKKEQK